MEPFSARWDVVAELPALLRYARALTREADAAEELVQETLSRAYGRRLSFREGEALRPWLFAILHNTFISQQRRRVRRERLEAEAADGAPAGAAPDQEHAAELAQVRDAFQRLSLEHREVLHLVTVEGLSYQQTAEATGAPIGTVMSRLSRARAALRGLMNASERPASAPRLRIVGGSDEA